MLVSGSSVVAWEMKAVNGFLCTLGLELSFSFSPLHVIASMERAKGVKKEFRGREGWVLTNKHSLGPYNSHTDTEKNKHTLLQRQTSTRSSWVVGGKGNRAVRMTSRHRCFQPVHPRWIEIPFLLFFFSFLFPLPSFLLFSSSFPSLFR